MHLTLWGQAEYKKWSLTNPISSDWFESLSLQWKIPQQSARINSIGVCEAVELSSESNTAAAALKATQKEVQEIRHTVAMEVNKQHVCVNCKHRNDYDKEDTSDLIQCKSYKITTLKENLAEDDSAYIIIAFEKNENLGRFYCNKQTLDEMFQSLSEVEGYHLQKTQIICPQQ